MESLKGLLKFKMQKKDMHIYEFRQCEWKEL